MKALEKAQSLYTFVSARGAMQSEFQLPLTDAEAFELLEEYAIEGYRDCERYQIDLVDAKKAGNPWSMIANFRVLGFELIAQRDLH